MKSRLSRALVCAPRMPEFDRESGSRRVFHIIEFLQSAGWSVTFVADNGSDGERYARLLRRRGVTVCTGFDSHTDEMIATGLYDLAIFAFWELAEAQLPRVRALSPATRVVIDAIDLHFVRSTRQALRPRPDGVTAEVVLSTGSNFIREINTYVLADAVLAVSEKEAQLVSDLTGEPLLGVWVPDAEDLELSAVPLTSRKGVVFVGNFRHKPNVDALDYLCREIVPKIEDALARHPLSIVGNDLDKKMLPTGRGMQHVAPIGWVPSVIPYLDHARASVIPLTYGAGTKRKLIQALMAGTPTVSTSIGVEGLDLEAGREVLVADDPAAFGKALETLLTDDQIWTLQAKNGRAAIERLHGTEVVRGRFLSAVDRILDRVPKPGPSQELALARRNRLSDSEYQMLKQRVAEVVGDVLPRNATVVVASRGDPELVRLDGLRAWHFPQNDQGDYLGYHPLDSAAAIDELEKSRARGAEFLALPSSSFWWLEHYPELAAHLDQRYKRVWADQACIVYDLRTSAVREPAGDLGASLNGAAGTNGHAPARPATVPEAKRLIRRAPRLSTLVVGIYLADRANHVDDIVGVLSESRVGHVRQQWVGLCGPAPTKRVAEVTTQFVSEPTPKYQLLNSLLVREDLEQYDYIVTVDDDILLPQGFISTFLPMQAKLDFAIAQPARTSGSYIDHPIVEQQRGVLARQTLFVEIGPLVSFHRSIFHLVFPFDSGNPMGWGFENVWSYRLLQANLRMGIIDATPVDHSLRKPVEHYSWNDANESRSVFFAATPHHSYEECFHVLDVVTVSK